MFATFQLTSETLQILRHPAFENKTFKTEMTVVTGSVAVQAQPQEREKTLKVSRPIRLHRSGHRFTSAMLENSRLPKLGVEDIICTMNLSKANVIHIEPVLSIHLLEPFLDIVARLQKAYPQSDGRWDIAFHGTLPENTKPIIENGFKLPSLSKSVGHQSRFLWNWGPGIYCSPYGTYSYPFGHRWEHGIFRDHFPIDPDATVYIFICAVIRGRIYQCELSRCRKYSGLEPGFDSHKCFSQLEWIVFDEKMIIPLYLMAIKKSIPQAFFPSHHRPLPGCSLMEPGTEDPLVTAMNTEYMYRHPKGLTHEQVVQEATLKERIIKLGNGRSVT